MTPMQVWAQLTTAERSVVVELRNEEQRRTGRNVWLADVVRELYADRISMTVTGRAVKDSHPAIQNIPIRTPEGTAIRQALVDSLEK